MMRDAIAAVVLLLPITGAASQPMGGGRWGMMGPGMMANMARHHQAMMYGIPVPYRTLRDPVPNTPAKFARGAAVFQENCASCHGQSGHGEGPAGQQLVPPPANLAWLAHMPMSRSDPYMYWTIAEGGKSIGSDMPSFKGTLSKSDIWAVISHIREGLGARR
jgi:mono/diheme cytochrome c family protein